MKTSKMIKGFALIGLLLFICSATFAQSSNPASEADPFEQVRGTIDLQSSGITNGTGVVYNPVIQDIKEYPDKPGAVKPTAPVTTREAPLPSYETANVTTATLPNGGTLRIKVPSQEDAEPAFINTGDVDLDKRNYEKALNEFFGTEEFSETQDQTD